MNLDYNERKFCRPFRATAFVVIFTFCSSMITPLPKAHAQTVTPTYAVGLGLNLPAPGAMVSLTPAFTPPIIRGMTIHPDNPLEFNFLVDTGDDQIQGEFLRDEANKLIKYFMASLTVPEDQMWVNLSPYEKNCQVPLKRMNH